MFAIYFNGNCFQHDFESLLWLVHAPKNEVPTIEEFIEKSIYYLIQKNELETEYQTRTYSAATKKDIEWIKIIIAEMNQTVTFYFEDIIRAFTIEPTDLYEHLLAIETENYNMLLYWHTTF